MRTKSINHEGVMTVGQVADYLQLNRLTVYKYIRSGQLPASKLGRSYRVRKADVDWFLESQRVSAARRPRMTENHPARLPLPPLQPVETVVAPKGPDEVDLRDIDLGLRDPLVWMIRGLH